MKRILQLPLLIVFLLLSLNSTAQEPLTPLFACDTGSQTALFNIIYPYVEAYDLSGTTPTTHTVRFFESEVDLLANQNQIVGFEYMNISNPQTLYIKLENNDDANDYTVYTTELIVHLLPEFAANPIDLFSESANFDLTVNTPIVLGGNTGISVFYYETAQDADFGTNPITNPSNYFSQGISATIWIRIIDDNTACMSAATTFNLYIQNGDLEIPTTVVQNICDDNSDGLVIYDLTNAIPTILGDLSEVEHNVSFHATGQGALNNNNFVEDTTNYIAGGAGWQVFCRIQNTSTNEVGYTTLLLSVKRKPIIYTIPDVVAYQGNDFTGTASFNLVDEVAMGDFFIIPNESGSATVRFFLNEEDAVNNENDFIAIGLNPQNFTNTSNPQILYVSVVNTTDGVEGCEPTVAPFQLRVEPGDEEIVFIPDANFKAKILEADVTNPIAQNLNWQNMKIDANNDGEIQISEARAVGSLNVSNASIADLTGLNSFIYLTGFNASTNQVTTINTTGLHFMVNLFLENNPLTEATLVDLNNIVMLNLSNTDLTHVDLSQTFGAFEFYCSNTPNLTSLNVKNGVQGNIYLGLGEWENNEIINTTALELICADDFNIDGYLDSIGGFQDTENIIVNSYCSFSPEGNNLISGTVTYDYNNDGCGEEDITRFTKIIINDGIAEGASFSNVDGNYLFYTQAGTFALHAQLENPSFFTVTPTSSMVNFPLVDGSEEIVNFCITPNGLHPDLEVVIAPLQPARPGFNATYQLVYRNKGNQILSQEYGLSFFYNQQLMSYVSSSVNPDTQIDGALNWSYENLLPFESRSIIVTLLINTPTDTENPVNINDELVFTAVIMPQDGDENVSDNTFVFNQVVVGAYDPNDITCIEGDLVSPDLIGEELHYVIRFENTGNFYAENVVVVMDIDPLKYDISSLKVLGSSHDVRAQVKGTKAEFYFNDIYLDSGGHGNILLVMNSKNSLLSGDFVKSKADIYFDYNYPIITNEAETLFEALSVENPVLDNIISIYPNPVKDIVNIAIKDNSTIKTIELYDIQGRLLQTQVVNNISSELNLSSRANGMYFVKINTDLGSKVEKLIKE